jgi:hypothetical protein
MEEEWERATAAGVVDVDDVGRAVDELLEERRREEQIHRDEVERLPRERGETDEADDESGGPCKSVPRVPSLAAEAIVSRGHLPSTGIWRASDECLGNNAAVGRSR